MKKEVEEFEQTWDESEAPVEEVSEDVPVEETPPADIPVGEPTPSESVEVSTSESPADEAPVEPDPLADVPVEEPYDEDKDPEIWKQRFKSYQGTADSKLKSYQDEIAALKAQLGGPTGEEPVAGSVDEDDDIKRYVEDYPEIAIPQIKLLRKELGNFAKAILNELEVRDGAVADAMQPLADASVLSSAKNHFDMIEKKHPDYQQLLDSGALDQWVSTLPPEAQEKVNAALDGGSYQDVNMILDQFKAETGGQPQATPEMTPPAAPPPPQPSPEQMAGLQDMQAVVSKGPSTPPTGQPATGFDDAFEEAVRSLKG